MRWSTILGASIRQRGAGIERTVNGTSAHRSYRAAMTLRSEWYVAEANPADCARGVLPGSAVCGAGLVDVDMAAPPR